MMQHVIRVMMLVAILLFDNSLSQGLSPKQALTLTLKGIFIQNKLTESPESLTACLDDESAQLTFDLISSSFQKGSKGSISDIISIIQDLHTFYDSLPSTLKKCITQQDSLLKLNYKYGIGYLPLGQIIFKRYVSLNFLQVHFQFNKINDLWNEHSYYEAGMILAQYGHQVYPIIKRQIRGVWLTNVASQVLDSRLNIKEAIDQCKKAHINTIFIVVYNNARTIYPSTIMEELIGIKQQEKYKGRDPLQELISAAKGSEIEVHAWFQYGFSSSYSAEGGPIVTHRPSWKGLDSSGNLVVKNGFDWLNGFDPQVQNFMISLFKEVITSYDIEGVQGDDRLPALPSISGYQPYTISLYQQEHSGQSPPSDHTEASWVNWRVNKLNQFMKKLYLQVKQLNPSIFLSIAPSPYPWSVTEYLQDWPTWVKNNWVDAVIPQCYRYSLDAYLSVLKQQIQYVVNPKVVFGSGILLNVGNYVANVTFLQQMVQYNRNSGINGESFFFYEGIVKQKDWFQHQYPLINSEKLITK